MPERTSPGTPQTRREGGEGRVRSPVATAGSLCSLAESLQSGTTADHPGSCGCNVCASIKPELHVYV